MRIGVDFDGVICNMSLVKGKYARDFWGVVLSPESCTFPVAKDIVQPIIAGFGLDFIRNKSWDGGAEYAHLCKLLEVGPMMLSGYPEKDCVRCLGLLRRAGHKIVIVTTVNPVNSKWVYAFLKKYAVPFDHLVCVPYDRINEEIKKYDKKYVINKLKLNVLIDDLYKNLDPLSGSGVLLYFFSQPWNAKMNITKQDIERVSGWQDVYAHIQQLVASGVGSVG